MAAARNQQKPLGPILIPLSIAIAALLIWNGWPGLVLIWVGLLISAFTYPSPPMSRAPTPAEEHALVKYRYWSGLKTALLLPGKNWLPSWPIHYTWMLALASGLVALALPVEKENGHWLNALSAFVVISQLAAVHRDTMISDDTCPGTRTSDLISLIRQKPRSVLVPGIAALVLGTVAAFIAVPYIPERGWGLVCGTILAIPLLATFVQAKHEAIDHWKMVVSQRARWKERWKLVKMDPGPRLLDRKFIGDPANPTVIIDTFRAASTGSAQMLTMSDKIVPLLEGQYRVAVASVPSEDQQGQPMPGTVSSVKFEVIQFPSDAVPDPADSSTTPEVMNELVRSAFAWMGEQAGMTPGFTSVDLVSIEDSPTRAWAISINGIGAKSARSQQLGIIGALFGAGALLDHRGNGGQGVLFVGDLFGCTLDPQTGLTKGVLENLVTEDTWTARWNELIKQGDNPPMPQFPTANKQSLANGVEIEQLAFVTLNGMPPAQFFLVENKFATVLNGAPFASLAGWHETSGPRKGERHAQAFVARWSSSAAPSRPDDLAPKPGSQAPDWVLAALLNAGFKAGKLAGRPELISATALTKPSSRAHIWKMHVRLYDGVTLSDVRTQARRIKETWASAWLRVAEAPDGCYIYAGAQQSKVDLKSPSVAKEIDALDWEQVFIDSKISGLGGSMPRLVSTEHLEQNQQVKKLRFDLAGTGLVFATFKGERARLESNSGNAFVEPREVRNKPQEIDLMVCEIDPMPERSDYDWAFIDEAKGIPFATGVEGEPIQYDFRDDPHLLIAGASGGGKLNKWDALIPVPVSKRFPSGWAQNYQLCKGDLVYAPDGTTTPIVGFSNWETKRGYKLRFGDKQEVIAGPEHLWKVSTAATRSVRTPLKNSARDNREKKFVARAGELRALAKEIGVGTSAPLMAIAKLSGFSELSLYGMSLPIKHLADVVALPSRKKSRQFDMAPVVEWMSHPRQQAGGIVTFAGKKIAPGDIANIGLSGWMTKREMADAIMGRPSTRAERSAANLILYRLKPASRESNTTFMTNVYPVDEVLTMLADRLEHQSVRAGNGVKAPDIETIMTTEEMAKSVLRKTDAREALNYAVRATKPIDGPEADLPIDPYVMGAWLGDGSSRCGEITSGVSRLCQDSEGIADQTYMLERLSPHYFSRQKPSEESVIAMHGLTTDLRTAGVLNNKHIPAAYLRASHAQRLALLQGLMDTDGTINKRGTCEIDLCYKPLADGVLELVRSLGIIAKQRTDLAKITEADPDNPGQKRQRVTGNRYRLKFTTDQQIFTLPRKLERLPSELRSTQQWNYIESIEPTDDEVRMRCIKVAHPEHLFLVEGFIPTHNSVLLQSLIYGALVRGYEIYIADPTKGGADFQFAAPYAKAIIGEVFEASAMMKTVYAEVVRRKNLNAKYGVGNYRDLPDEIQPKHMILVLDEFTSLMQPDPLPTKSDDPELQSEYESAVALNKAKIEVGIYTGKIAREARSAGVTLFLATQKLTAKLLDSVPGGADLKTNLSRLLLGKATFGEKMSALKNAMEAPELGTTIPRGRGLFEASGNPTAIIQAWYNSAEQTILAQKLAERLDPLNETDRLDVSAFRSAPVDTGPAVVDYVLPDPEQVVELDEIDLSAFADLFTNDEDDEVIEGELEIEQEPARETLDEPSEMRGPLLLLDIDGCVAPFHSRPGLWTLPAGKSMGRGTFLYDPQAIAILDDAEFDKAFITDWGPDAIEAWGSMMEVTSSVEGVSEVHGWWKIDAALAYVREHPTERVVWVDDLLSQFDERLGMTYGDQATILFSEMGVKLICVSPDGNYGLDAESAELVVFALQGHVDQVNLRSYSVVQEPQSVSTVEDDLALPELPELEVVPVIEILDLPELPALPEITEEPAPVPKKRRSNRKAEDDFFEAAAIDHFDDGGFQPWPEDVSPRQRQESREKKFEDPPKRGRRSKF